VSIPLTRNTYIVVPENLFRRTAVDDRKRTHCRADSIHSSTIDGASRRFKLVFQSRDDSIAEGYPHPFADLLSQTMGDGILDILKCVVFFPQPCAYP
jgi:hypothetical protein